MDVIDKKEQKELTKWYNHNADFIDPILETANRSWNDLSWAERKRLKTNGQ